MTAKQLLSHGDKYPYDAPDIWRDQLNPEPIPAEDWAHRAARGVLVDLTDRRGIKNGFDDVDEDVRKDIVNSLASIIREAERAKNAD